MPPFTDEPGAFAPAYLATVRKGVLGSRWLAVNTLNRDFVGTRGFSIVFRRETLDRVVREFPWAEGFLTRVLRQDCNAFYMNPLLLGRGSRVDPHVDRSLSGYCPTVVPPVAVSVLYVEVPAALQGGRLVLQRGKKLLGRIEPAAGKLVGFHGDLLHSVERVDSDGQRMSLVCEQYALTPEEMDEVPAFLVESRAAAYR